MTRIAPPETPTAEQAALFDQCDARLGFVPMTLRVMANRPEMLDAWYRLISEVYLKPGDVPAPLRRLIAHTVARIAECPYSMAHTAEAAFEAGVPIEKIRAVMNSDSDPQFDDAERAALAVARASAAAPASVDDELFDALRPHFTEAQMLEIMAVISLFGFLTRWQSGLALTLEDKPRHFAEENLAEIGWAIGQHGGNETAD
jgi:uncharacterized peroxidase-related enzyme